MQIDRFNEYIIRAKCDKFTTYALLLKNDLLETEEEFVEEGWIGDEDSIRLNLNDSSSNYCFTINSFAVFSLMLLWYRDEYSPSDKDLELFDYYNLFVD